MAETTQQMTDKGPTGGTRRLIGLTLIVAGVLWLATTGLCTAWALFFMISAYDLTAGDLLLILVVGGTSALIGWGLRALGRRLRP